MTFCDREEGLAEIRTPSSELVIWRRALPLCLTAWLERLDRSALNLRTLVQPRHFRDALATQLDDCGIAHDEMRALLIADVERLVGAFSSITKSDLVDVRLQGLSNDACWRFHRDCVSARLLTTYFGPATQWVLPRNGEAALREQTDYRGPLEQMDPNDVAIFKGSCAGAGSGIVHRSPPIAGSGQTRVLLCLNERSAASPKPWIAAER